jgi:hypothetical protein
MEGLRETGRTDTNLYRQLPIYVDIYTTNTALRVGIEPAALSGYAGPLEGLV